MQVSFADESMSSNGGVKLCPCLTVRIFYIQRPSSQMRDSQMNQLKNKWVLITGASSGFGAAAARAFGVEGARLLLGARRVDRLKQVAAESKKAGAGEALFHELDVSKTASVEHFIEWTRGQIGNRQLA